MFYPATPAEIAGQSETKDLGAWLWRQLGRAWPLQRDWPVAGLGLITVTLTGYADGRPWGEGDERSLIDDLRVWMRGPVDGRLVLPPEEHLSGDPSIFACDVPWTENAARPPDAGASIRGTRGWSQRPTRGTRHGGLAPTSL